MTGSHAGGRLSAFLDDELDDGAALDVVRHLADCPGCRTELEQIRATRSALRDLPPVDVPLSFMVESVVLGPRHDPDGPSTVVIGALVAVSVLLVTAFAVGGDTGAVRPDVATYVGDHVETVGGGPVVVPVSLEE